MPSPPHARPAAQPPNVATPRTHAFRAHDWRADARFRSTPGLAVPFAATIKQQPDELAAVAAAVRECGVVVRAVLVGCETGMPHGE